MIWPHPNRDFAQASDAELVAAARAGRPAAWAALVHRFQRLVYSTARDLQLSPAEASDVFLSVFAELWPALAQLEHPERVGAWLAEAAWRHGQAHRVAQRPGAALAAFAAPAQGGMLDLAEREQVMRRALAQLAPRCRHLLEWIFLSDPVPEYAEIVRRVGLGGGTMGFVRSSCLQRLRQALEQDCHPAPAPPAASVEHASTTGSD